MHKILNRLCIIFPYLCGVGMGSLLLDRLVREVTGMELLGTLALVVCITAALANSLIILISGVE